MVGKCEIKTFSFLPFARENTWHAFPFMFLGMIFDGWASLEITTGNPDIGLRNAALVIDKKKRQGGWEVGYWPYVPC